MLKKFNLRFIFGIVHRQGRSQDLLKGAAQKISNFGLIDHKILSFKGEKIISVANGEREQEALVPEPDAPLPPWLSYWATGHRSTVARIYKLM